MIAYCRVKDLQTLGVAETKLLYTLHWILLFADDECTDAENEQENGQAALKTPHLFSVATISVNPTLKISHCESNSNGAIILFQLFVYLFAPIAHHLKESDFQNFRLENGIKLWQGMWEYKTPGAPCFSAPVKPKARQLITCLSGRNVTPESSERKSN